MAQDEERKKMVEHFLAMKEAEERAECQRRHVRFPGDPPDDPGGRPVVLVTRRGRKVPARLLREYPWKLIDGDRDNHEKLTVTVADLVANFAPPDATPDWRPVDCVPRTGTQWKRPQATWEEAGEAVLA
jgi:hypothetical protein